MEQIYGDGAPIPNETFFNFLAAQREAQLQYAELSRMNPAEDMKWSPAGPVPNYTEQERDTLLHANSAFAQHNQIPSSSSRLAPSTAAIPQINTDLCRPSVVQSSHFLDHYDHFGAQYSQQLLSPFLSPCQENLTGPYLEDHNQFWMKSVVTDFYYETRDMDMNTLRPNDEPSGLLPKDLESKSMTFPYSTRGNGDEVLFNPMFSYQMTFPMQNPIKRPIKEEVFGLQHHDDRESAMNTSQAAVTSTTRHSQDCQVCQSTQANGLHFGARTCAACAAFFRRTISDDKKYVCKRSQRCNNPSKDGTGYRKICRACRLKRCMDIGMLPENVQHKRIPTDSMPKSSSLLGDVLDSQSFDAAHTLDTLHFDSRTFDARTMLESAAPFDQMIPFYNHLATSSNLQ